MKKRFGIIGIYFTNNPNTNIIVLTMMTPAPPPPSLNFFFLTLYYGICVPNILADVSCNIFICIVGHRHHFTINRKMQFNAKCMALLA